MNYTWGFLMLSVIMIIPGIIIRRLYFFGEFSKQYGANEPILKLITISLFPGALNAILSFYGYQFVATLFPTILVPIDINEILVVYNSVVDFKGFGKEINDQFLNRLNNTNAITDPTQFAYKKAPYYLSYIYVQAIIIGGLIGRTLHFINLDKRFKVLRYNNYWYYAFSNDHLRFKKYKAHQEIASNSNANFVYTKADVVIDSADGPLRYSGIIVDYNLDPHKSAKLSNIILRSTKFYTEKLQKSKKKKKRKNLNIPGSFMIIDCSSLLNINLTHVYVKRIGLNEKWARPVFTIYGLFYFFMVTITLFRFGLINWKWYNDVFLFHWSERILIVFALMAFLSAIFPISKTGPNLYKWKAYKSYERQLEAFIIFALIAWGYSAVFFN